MLAGTMSSDDLAEAETRAALVLDALARVAELQDSAAPVRHRERNRGRPATEADDPFNAIIRWCNVKGAAVGPLAGMRIGVKDSIPVAGVPMTVGVRSAREVVPTEDAVAIKRLLNAGAVISAKTNIAGSGFGPTRNPRNADLSPGYSSSGSAAAVAGGLVDAALGTDVAGSVRIPAAWCGVIGMKPTHRLVPSFFSMADHTMDEVGPITATVSDNMAVLEIMAGRNSNGSRYREAVGAGVAGLRLGVVREAVQTTNRAAGTRDAFARATAALAGLGADVVSVSVPAWETAAIVALATLDVRLLASVDHWPAGDAAYEGRFDERLLAGIAAHPNHARECALLRHVRDRVRARGEDLLRGYARAQNARLELRRQVDGALARVDLLITPTTVAGPHRLEEEQLADPMAARRRLELQIRNTVPLNLTGHPALSVPARPGHDDLPSGLQIVGRPFDEYTVYRAACALESSHVT